MEALGRNGREFNPDSGNLTKHNNAIAVEGLDDLFKWASEMVADGEDGRVKHAREQRIRRQVLETVQRLKEQEAVTRAAGEIAYLQRRLIALLQRLQEITEENSVLKQIMVAQHFALDRIPALEEEVLRLRQLEFSREQAQKDEQELLKALSKLKMDRDYLDELLRLNEDENTRLSALLSQSRSELGEFKSRRWWHAFIFWR